MPSTRAGPSCYLTEYGTEIEILTILDFTVYNSVHITSLRCNAHATSPTGIESSVLVVLRRSSSNVLADEIAVLYSI